VSTRATADAGDRERIATDLDTNLLVEAGAGSGKTTGLVARMLALIGAGVRAEQIAAVTFTRKATSELRERFEEQLEAKTRELAGTPDGQLYRQALAERDRAFIGTIHAFCGRLLREHPLEAGLDPAFEEVDEDAWPVLAHGFWSRWLERMRQADDPLLRALASLGIDPRILAGAFSSFITYPDVHFPAEPVPAPDPGPCRKRLRALLAKVQALMPGDEPDNGYDKLQRTCRRLHFWQNTRDWEQLPAFAAALGTLRASQCAVTQNRWPDKKAAKALGEEWSEFLDGDVARLLSAWREHCYSPAIAFLSRAADEFAHERLRNGTLGFEDLLLGAVRLLRGSARARRALGERFRYLLVDEFQDTDPVQAELCFLLASEPSEGVDWRLVRLRPGALFVVGDPKQSIYRFRRADIQTYELVKRRIAAQGAVLRLTSNFRSVHPIARFVDGHFSRAFPANGSAAQAPFAPLATEHAAGDLDGVYCYGVTPDGNNQDDIHREDGARVASLIAGRIASGAYRASDFLLLAINLKSLAPYARELSARNIPVSVTGAPLPQEEELGELLILLRALADPGNRILVVAALEGLCFGISVADLDQARTLGIRFTINQPPADTACTAGQALAQLHRWWLLSRDLPADLLLERILDETGLLPYAAGLSLGDARAGALLHLVELLRAESGAAGLSLPDAVELIDTALQSSRAETPLRPGRRDAVRVMNLHKAKGLEARVVILVAPIGQKGHEPAVHIRRSDEGAATGGLRIMAGDDIIAQPAGWAEMAAREAEFVAAERERLLYVASTRASRELIVSQLVFENKSGPAADRSFWSPLAAALSQHATAITLPLDEPPGRREPAEGVEEIEALAESAVAGCRQSARVTTRTTSVTRSLKEVHDDRATGVVPAARGLGARWGALVHTSLEAMGRGRTGQALERYVTALVREECRGESDAGRTATVQRVLALLARVRETPEWQRLDRATIRAFELPVISVSTVAGVDVVTQGIADAVALVDGAWQVLDWKTDRTDDAGWCAREPEYQAQVDSYARMIEARGGVAATGSIVRVREG
jgi:ATP-dependent helicase/nuclease subunit A